MDYSLCSPALTPTKLDSYSRRAKSDLRTASIENARNSSAKQEDILAKRGTAFNTGSWPGYRYVRVFRVPGELQSDP